MSTAGIQLQEGRGLHIFAVLLANSLAIALRAWRGARLLESGEARALGGRGELLQPSEATS